jgi:hypothetical protein
MRNWHLGIGWRRNRYLSHAARAWLEVARAVYEKPAENFDDFVLARGLGRR